MKTCASLWTAFAFVASTCTTGPANADGAPKDVVVFGDSLSDPGNAFALTHKLANSPYAVIPNAPYAVGGLHFSNGKTWIEQRPADAVNAQSAGPAYQVHGVFTNYAVGGAGARDVPGFVNLSDQVQTYLADFGGKARPTSTHVIFIGGNDIQDALYALGGDPTGAASAAILTAAVTSVATNISYLYAAGATRFVIVNAADAGLAPAVRMQGPLARGAATFLSEQYNSGLSQVVTLFSGLISITLVDFFSEIRNVDADPGAYGLTNTTDMCIIPGVKGAAKCSNPNEYLFWDGVHPTSAAHALLADLIGPAL
jgi:outer membrane lipase/esterase